MMRDVAGTDVGEGAHGHRFTAREAPPIPHALLHRIEQRYGRGPDRGELVEMAGPGAPFGERQRHRDVLVERGERSLETAGEPERAERKDAFRIVHVTDDL